MNETDGRVLLGKIVGAQGLKGEVVVHAYTEAPEDVAAYGPLSSADGARSYELKVVRVAEKGVIARISGVGDRTAAERLKGTELWIDRGRLPEPEADEFYHADLIGLAAVDPDGAEIGRVVGVQNYGAGDLIEVRLAGGKRTELVAFTPAFVPEVNLEKRQVVVVLAGSETEDEGGEGEGGEREGGDDTSGAGGAQPA